MALSLTAIVMWVAIIGLSSIVGWHLLAFLLVPNLPAKLRDPIGRIWLKMTMWAWDGSLVVETEDGRLDMVPFDADAEHNAIMFSIDGEERTVDDPLNAMGYLERRPFGVVVDGVGSVVRPWMAAIGEDERAKVADGGHVKVVEDADSGERVFAHNPFVKVRDTERVVDMRNVMDILTQLADTDLANRVQTRAIASQADRGPNGNKLLIVAGIAALVGYGLALFTAGGGEGVSVGLITALGVM
jgi:hypothetical protein